MSDLVQWVGQARWDRAARHARVIAQSSRAEQHRLLPKSREWDEADVPHEVAEAIAQAPRMTPAGRIRLIFAAHDLMPTYAMLMYLNLAAPDVAEREEFWSEVLRVFDGDDEDPVTSLAYYLGVDVFTFDDARSWARLTSDLAAERRMRRVLQHTAPIAIAVTLPVYRQIVDLYPWGAEAAQAAADRVQGSWWGEAELAQREGARELYALAASRLGD